MRFLIIFSIFFGYACSNTPIIEEKNNTQTESTLVFSAEKIKLAGIETGYLAERNISDLLHCKGFIKVPPHNRAKVSVPLAGYVKELFIKNGEKVRKSQKLISIEHIDFIKLQQDFLQAKSEYEYLKTEYKRQSKLYEEEALNEKVFGETKSRYEQKKSLFFGLKKQLEILSINTSVLSAESISSKFIVMAPIKGNIDEILITMGEYVTPDETILEIVDDTDFHVELQVFERDINTIKIGQKVSFDCSMPESKNTTHTAIIDQIGNTVDQKTKTIQIHAIPENCSLGMRHGIYINARIHVSDKLLPVVPEEAVISSNGVDHVFISQNDSVFVFRRIQTGKKTENSVEIIKGVSKNDKVVVKGVNYLFAEMFEE